MVSIRKNELNSWADMDKWKDEDMKGTVNSKKNVVHEQLDSFKDDMSKEAKETSNDVFSDESILNPNTSQFFLEENASTSNER